MSDKKKSIDIKQAISDGDLAKLNWVLPIPKDIDPTTLGGSPEDVKLTFEETDHCRDWNAIQAFMARWTKVADANEPPPPPDAEMVQSMCDWMLEYTNCKDAYPSKTVPNTMDVEFSDCIAIGCSLDIGFPDHESTPDTVVQDITFNYDYFRESDPEESENSVDIEITFGGINGT